LIISPRPLKTEHIINISESEDLACPHHLYKSLRVDSRLAEPLKLIHVEGQAVTAALYALPTLRLISGELKEVDDLRLSDSLSQEKEREEKGAEGALHWSFSLD